MADNNANQNANNTNQNENGIVQGLVGLFHSISGTKTRVVYTNVFTGEIKVKSGGIFLNLPWRRKAVKISLDQHKVDTVERRAITLGGQGANVQVGPSVTYDTDYFVKIVDPEKYMDAAYSSSPSQITRNIGDILDQKIQDYIKRQQYDALIAHSSVDFLNEIGRRNSMGAFPVNSLNQELLDTYGIEVTKITFKVKPPKELSEEATKTKLAEQAKRTAQQEQERLQMEAEGEAKRMRITSEAEADKDRLKGEALADNISSWIASGMTNEQIATKLANYELVNGKNEHTIVMAAANQAQVQSGNSTYDAVLMMQLFNQMMQQNQQIGVQSQQQPQQQQQPIVEGQSKTVDWDSLSDAEYLSAEDSAALAQERGDTILPGARYHISYLTAEEKNRYHVARPPQQR